MSDAPAPAEGAKPAKSKKMLIIIVAAVVVLLAGGGGAWFMLKSKADPAEEEVAHAKPSAPPTFLPLESMVVNLADPGGDRFAQIGITLEITDTHAADQVKAFMPVIRSGILMVISQRTTQELLGVEGKEKLALDIKREVSTPLGYPDDDEAQDEPEEKPAAKKSAKAKAEKKPKKKHEPNPIKRVLFSSFIVQ